MIYITAVDIETPEKFIIELEEPKGTEVLNQFENDCEFLIDNLKILNQRLVLLNPVYISTYFRILLKE
jgi:hypothetical protein